MKQPDTKPGGIFLPTPAVVTIALAFASIIAVYVFATKAELMNVDPWGPDDFGSAGVPAEDFVDPVFVPGLCN